MSSESEYREDINCNMCDKVIGEQQDGWIIWGDQSNYVRAICPKCGDKVAVQRIQELLYDFRMKLNPKVTK